MSSLSNWLLLMTLCGDKLYQVADEECNVAVIPNRNSNLKAQALLLLLLLLCSEAVCLFAWLQGGLLYACLVIQHMLDHMMRLKQPCLQDPEGVRRQTQQLPPLEVPKALQDVKTDLVHLFLTNMASDEVSVETDHKCFAGAVLCL